MFPAAATGSGKDRGGREFEAGPRHAADEAREVKRVSTRRHAILNQKLPSCETALWVWILSD